MSLDTPLILIGPAATGKTTLGQIVVASLSVPFVDIDEIAEPYYEESGWNLEKLSHRSSTVGRVAAEREWEGLLERTLYVAYWMTTLMRLSL